MSVYPSCNKVSTIKNAVKIEGNVQANIIYMNTENELDSVVKNIPYESEITADVSPLSNCTIESDVSTVNYGYILGSSKEIQARCILKAEVFLIKHSPVTVVSDFSEDKSLPIDKSSQPSITVCYPQSNTCLWDYAVKYNTTCEEIAQVNGISAGEELTPGKPLLIPKRQCVK